MRRATASIGLLVATAGCTEIVSALAPQADALDRWRAHEAASTRTVDHAAFDAFLTRFAALEDGIRRVDYAAAVAERAGLDAYVGALQVIDPRTLNRKEQLAYWINLYNAETVRVVLDHYPVESIQDVDLEGGGLFGGPWGAPRLHIGGEAVTLNDIEHGILRALWRDPRIHYVLNCASLGCPNLAAEAYTAANIEARLDAQARSFINHPRGVRVHDGEVRLSTIFQWYRSDFGRNDQRVLDHVREYASPELRQKLEGHASIDAYDYDWRLNEPGVEYPAP